MSELASTSPLVDQIRRAFDETFSAPAVTSAPVTARFLYLRIGGEALALPVTGKSARLSNLLVDRAIVRLPSPVSSFLGLAGVRGEIVPVFDLAPFVKRTSPVTTRWLAVVRLPEPAAFAFEELDGLVDLPVEDLLATSTAGVDGPNIARVARREGSLTPVLDLDAIADAIRRGARRPEPGSAR